MSLITICQIIVGASLAGMLFIFLRNLPLLAEFKPKPILPERKFFNRIKYNLGKTKTKVEEIFHKFVEKNSHKLRIFILKTDNFLISRARQAREKKIHFAKINFKKKKKEDYLVRKEENLKKEEEKELEKTEESENNEAYQEETVTKEKNTENILIKESKSILAEEKNKEAFLQKSEEEKKTKEEKEIDIQEKKNKFKSKFKNKKRKRRIKK